MNQPIQSSSTPAPRRLHPLMGAAAICVIVFCIVGVAAALGWLPAVSAPEHGAGAAMPAPVASLAEPPRLVPAPAPRKVAASNAPAASGRPAAANAPPAAGPACAPCGVVETIREVKVATGQASDGNNIVGTLAGGAAGGLVGNQFGDGHGRTALTVLGALGGAFAGREIERNIKPQPTVTRYEMRIRMSDNAVRTFHSEAPYPFASGDHVYVEGNQVRPR